MADKWPHSSITARRAEGIAAHRQAGQCEPVRGIRQHSGSRLLDRTGVGDRRDAAIGDVSEELCLMRPQFGVAQQAGHHNQI
jgi:hypothetical protein